ncbi:MAG: type II toxin-antitoxin system HicA family toxin [bacterium]
MGDFGAVDWKIFVKFVISVGCEFDRMKGDHRIYKKAGALRLIVIPEYDPLPPFIVMNNLRTLGLKKETLLKFLERNN